MPDTQHPFPVRSLSRRRFLLAAGSGFALSMVAACRGGRFSLRPEPTPEPLDLNLLVAEEFNFLFDLASFHDPWNEAFPHWPLTIHEGNWNNLLERVMQDAAQGQTSFDGVLPVAMPINTFDWLDRDLLQPVDPHFETSDIPGADRLQSDLYAAVRDAVQEQGQMQGIPGECEFRGLGLADGTPGGSRRDGTTRNLGRHAGGCPGDPGGYLSGAL